MVLISLSSLRQQTRKMFNYFRGRNNRRLPLIYLFPLEIYLFLLTQIRRQNNYHRFEFRRDK